MREHGYRTAQIGKWHLGEDLLGSLQQPVWQQHGMLPQRTVRIRQRQDNVQFAALTGALAESSGRIMDCLRHDSLEQNTVMIRIRRCWSWPVCRFDRSSVWMESF